MGTTFLPLRRAPRGTGRLTVPPPIDRAELSAEFDRALAEVEEHWPDAPVRDDAFGAYVRAHLDARPDLGARLTRLRIVDLFIVWWAMTSPAGVAAFLETFGHDLAHNIACITGRFTHVDPRSLIDQLIVDLFTGAEPRGREFSGLGSLHAWIEVVATQTFLDAACQRRPVGDGL
jgi:hypothetical protein